MFNNAQPIHKNVLRRLTPIIHYLQVHLLQRNTDHVNRQSVFLIRIDVLFYFFEKSHQ